MIGAHMNRNDSMKTRHIHGFTLIELLIAVTIVSILLGIAIPSYREQMRRGAVEEALAELGDSRVKTEQYFLDNRTYAGAPCPGATSKFAFECEGDATTYSITAKGSGNVDGFAYTLNEKGERTTEGAWGTGSCWLTRKGDTCDPG
jgi:type IV pilus assembly protein PilE